MTVEINHQISALGLALLLGVGIGLLYDLLRPPRRRLGRAAGAVLDGIFAALAGFAMFLYAMSADDGSLGLWELTATLMGFLTYMYLASPYIYPKLEGFYKIKRKIFRQIDEKEKFFHKILKKHFPNAKECFKIRK